MDEHKWVRIEELSYDHIAAAFRNEETDDVLVAECQRHPWMEEPEWAVRKTPAQESEKILKTIVERASVEEAEDAVEFITGREIALGERCG